MGETRVEKVRKEAGERPMWRRPDYEVIAASMEITAYLGTSR